MLIIYEGKDKQTEPKNNVPEHSNAPNWNNTTGGGRENSLSEISEDEESSDSDDDDESRNLSAKNKSSSKQNSHLCQQQQLISLEVTMKMIDFANVTFKGFLDDSVIHIGPDSGYLKGIDTLIRILFHALKEINLQEYKKSKY